jgi:hypothetical protein
VSSLLFVDFQIVDDQDVDDDDDERRRVNESGAEKTDQKCSFTNIMSKVSFLFFLTSIEIPTIPLPI